ACLADSYQRSDRGGRFAIEHAAGPFLEICDCTQRRPGRAIRSRRAKRDVRRCNPNHPRRPVKWWCEAPGRITGAIWTEMVLVRHCGGEVQRPATVLEQEARALNGVRLHQGALFGSERLTRGEVLGQPRHPDVVQQSDNSEPMLARAI